MAFEYEWKHNEANFGPPVSKQVPNGCHISLEIIPRYEGKIIALRRPNAIPDHELPPGAEQHPNGLLYFCHNLIRYGETVEACVRRTIQQQLGISIFGHRVLKIDSEVQGKDGQWAFTPHILAEIDALPPLSKEVTEIVPFTRDTVPNDFGWWTQDEVVEFITKHNL